MQIIIKIQELHLYWRFYIQKRSIFYNVKKLKTWQEYKLNNKLWPVVLERIGESVHPVVGHAQIGVQDEHSQDGIGAERPRQHAARCSSQAAAGQR